MDFPGFSLDLAALKATRQVDPAATYDLLILGGGPAAMSALIYAARKMLNLALITRDFGGQLLETSEVENWLGDQSINAKDLLARFEEHVKSFNLAVSPETGVSAVEKDGARFRLLAEDGRIFSGHTVIVATGMRHRSLGVPGEKELVGRGVAYCATCDAPLFKGKKVVVAGGGNSAFTTALDLIKVGAEITMLSRKPGWPADEAMQTRVRRHPGVTLLDNHLVIRVEGRDRLQAVVVKGREGGEEKRIPADGLFVEIGLIPNSAPVKGLADLNEQGEIMVDGACRTSVPGLFAAGDVTTVPHKQIVISAGEGAKAALSAYEYLVKKNLV